MKYTLPNTYKNAGLQVNIPDATLKQYRNELNSTKAAVDRWLYENGHLEKAEYEAMTAEKIAAPRKKREFKVDQEKAEIISFIYERMYEYTDENDDRIFENLEIANLNRMISFSLGNNKYELTLVRKKQPK